MLSNSGVLLLCESFSLLQPQQMQSVLQIHLFALRFPLLNTGQ